MTKQSFTVLGLMSGTSMDGLDCGLFEICLTEDYSLEWQCRDFQTIPYTHEIQGKIAATAAGVGEAHELNRELGQLFARSANSFLKGSSIDLISSHGQTIAHDDGQSSTQVGSPQFLAKHFVVPVVYNVRAADIEAGGNGAPLMPFLDWLLFKVSGLDTITLNLGGVANISFIPKSGKREDVLGFDTGPGMALIDESCRYFFNEAMDKHGQHSVEGRVNEEVLAQLITKEFILKAPPKSTGRHEFGQQMVLEVIEKFPGLNPKDLIRTFCVFTAKSIAENLQSFLNFNPLKSRMIVSGGGVHHPVLMEEISQFTGIEDIKKSDQLGIGSDLKESLLMAVLGVTRIAGIPANMPSVTGAGELVVLGDLMRYCEFPKKYAKKKKNKLKPE